uniref:Actin-related protein 10 n=1 Tax=Romanomermis culicivorax TaxID=13658 RepID=A0A915HX37_ROMCU
KLLVNPKERRVVLLESVLSPSDFRNLLADVLFMHFEVPSVVFLPSHLAACFPLGTQGALVVDVGFRETLVL